MGHESIATESPIARLSPRKQELLRRHLAARLTAPHAEAIRPRGAGAGRFPLSFAQQSMWFLDRLQPGNAAFTISEALRLSGHLDRVALAAALAEVVRRHDVLRATFELEDGGPVQVIARYRDLAVPLVDLAGLAPAAADGELQRLAAAAAISTFDLGQGPLYRFLLLACSAGEHALLLAFHHTVCDAWSMDVLFGELRALYRGFAVGLPSRLPPLPIQYADFAAWQRERLQGEALASQLAYWRQRLAGASGLLALPLDRPRPPVATAAGDRLDFDLPLACADRLRELAQRQGATLFMVLLALFGALLHRYTGQEDLMVGSPVANRSRPEVERLIGLFIDTVVLRLDLSGGPSLRSLVARARETCLGAFSHAELPFERIVEAARPDRDAGRSPLFQVLFVLLPAAPPAGVELAGDVTSTPLPVHNRSAPYDLELVLMDTAGQLAGAFLYNTDLFDRTTAARLARSLERLVEGGIADPEAPLAEIPWLDAAERHQLLLEWNDSAVHWPRDRCAHELICGQAESLPHSIAVLSGGGVEEGTEFLTYGELERRANRLAHHLRRLGVETDRRVAVLLRRSPDLAVTLLAALKSGGAYVPLDPSYPRERLEHILADCAPAVLVTVLGLRDLLPADFGQPLEVVCLDRDREAISRYSAAPPAGLAAPGDLAYVIYTSGSTGRPKGAMVDHRGLLNHLLAKVSDLGLGPADVVAQTAPAAFDISVWQLLAALLAGGRVLVVPDAVAHAPARLLAEVDRAGVTVLETVPSLLAAIVDEAAHRGAARPRLAALRWLIATGEALPPELCRQWLRHYSAVAMLNAYGPTECSDDVTHHVLRSAPAIGAAAVPIGRPVANLRLYVLDSTLRPVPTGVSGELCVGGIGVGRGYLGKAARTAAVFLPDPFAASPGARLYRTGDLARHLPDGSLEFQGRIDHQVKIRGFRIELGEIEATLASHPAVSEVVVLGRAAGGESQPEELRLAAYLVLRQEVPAPDGDELRAFVSERLPVYMVPASFTFLPELPRTPQGKIARQALPAPEQKREHQREPLALPRSLVELTLTNLWEELLGVHPIGVGDNFFALGGHSLLAVSLMARIEQRFGRALPLSQLFAGATVAALARALSQSSSPQTAGSPLVEIQRGESGRSLLFLVHPAGGQVLCYLPLARALGREQPVYGLQDPGVYQDGEPRFEVAEMAALYVDALREAQPRGPYLLGGWSLGGALAQEMARRLEQAGEEVDLLLLFDARCPTASRDGGEEVSEEELLVWFAAQLGVLVTAAELAERLPADQLLFVLERCQAAGRLPGDFAPAQARRIVRLYSTEMGSLARHRPGPSRCPMLLLRAAAGVEDEREGGEDSTLGWGSLTGGSVETVVVPGSHQTLLEEPQVGAVAREIRARIGAAGGERSEAGFASVAPATLAVGGADR
ncbi:MAG TPA: amino acid adenylation domain-containing protein [Thermoanaerobaculia bacterium]|nr:amino acid adenylation domain-containing protein [Thermoanaerobaculia bacterium]